MTDTTAAPAGDNGGTPAGAAGNTGTPEQQPQSWDASLDEDTRAYIQNKGWKDPTDILSSYRNLEKYAGGSKNLLELPGEDADDNTLNNFYNKLGRPEKPDEYGFQPPENADPQLMDWFKNTAHQAGLNKQQASKLFDAWNEMTGSKLQEMQAQSREQSEKSINELKREWGSAYDSQIDAGKRAVAALGYDEARLNKLEDSMGTAEMLRLFATLGSKMGEDSFEGGRSDESFGGITPAVARQQIADLKLDNQFMAKYLKGDPDARSKMTRLMEKAYA